MWAAWVVVHQPSLDLAPAISGPMILGVGFVASFFASRASGSRSLFVAGLSGLLAGAVTLASVTSILVQQADPAAGPVATESLVQGGNRPPLPVLIAGFLATCTVLGLLAGTLARLLPSTKACEYRPLHCAAWTTLAAVVPLVVLGGLVTSTRSGLAVPDWPGTYGGNMFLYPVSLMASNDHVFLEHSHRLFGVLVGLCAISLVFLAFLGRASHATKTLAVIALVLIIIQGALGGLRVEIPSTAKAILHGILAQFIVGILGAAVATSGWPRLPSDEIAQDRTLRVFATALVHTTALQVVFGAIYRHTGGMHSLITHIVLSFGVFVLALIAGFRANSTPTPTDRRSTGRAVITLVILQVLLGWAAFMVAPPSTNRTVPKSDELSSIVPLPGWKSALRTAHQANGAFLMAAACALLAHARRGKHSAISPKPE